MRNKFKISILLVSVLLWWLFLCLANKDTDIQYFQSEYVTDFNEDKKVAWFADNIFVGKVIENLWRDTNNTERNFPNTLFKVEVLKNIKWDFSWDKIIAQEVSENKNGGLLIGEWDRIMEEWEVYLFTTRWEEIPTINSHNNGKHLISLNRDGSFSPSDNELIERFVQAYAEEILILEDGYMLSSGKNLYKNLSDTEKEVIDSVLMPSE